MFMKGAQHIYLMGVERREQLIFLKVEMVLCDGIYLSLLKSNKKNAAVKNNLTQ